MRNEIEKVLEAMRNDYKRWHGQMLKDDGDTESRRRIRDEMTEDYCTGLRVEENRRYWKITSSKGSQTSVSGFIVKAGDKKFLEGDMLKAAGWAAPARNFARGNVLDGYRVDEVRWTGIG